MVAEWSFEPVSTGNSIHWPELCFRYHSCLKLRDRVRVFQRSGLHLYFFPSPKLPDIFSQMWRGKVQNGGTRQLSHPGETLPLSTIFLHFPGVNTRGSCEINGTHCSRKPHFSCRTKCQLSLESKRRSPGLSTWRKSTWLSLLSLTPLVDRLKWA